MTAKNTVKIKCNPYKNTIEYYRLDCETNEWSPLDSVDSPFSKDKFTHTSLQKVSYEIVEHLNDTYNPGNVGLEIYFEGTKEDKKEIEEIISLYFEQCNIQVNDGENYLLSANYVKPRIEDIFKNMNESFKKFYDNNITKTISKFSETVKPTIPICVAGLYSSGKSAFINSLIGVELLPSASDPTTAKTFKISSGKKYEIKFEYGKHNERKNIVLSFRGSEYKVNQSAELKIIEELEKIKQYDTLEKRMYYALTIINNFDMDKNKYKSDKDKVFLVSDLIEITLPLNSDILPFNEYNFVIYDTPGSNSASNTDHTEVLKKAMEGQTNGLPIFVTTPDSMDNNDNKTLIETLEKVGGALDMSNLMIIVNKADEKDSGTLKDKKEKFSGLCISKLNPAGTYFVSAVIGLGSKKMLSGNTKSCIEEYEDDFGDTREFKVIIPNWIDSTYDTVYENNKKRFKNKKNRNYMQLYLYNIVPKRQYDAYCNLNLNDNMLIYQNSGLHAVEYAIAEFANKYALYNKCKNASDYLSKALEQLNFNLINAQQEMEEISKKLQDNMNSHEKDVMNRLKEACKKMEKDFIVEHDKGLNFMVGNRLEKIKGSILNEIEEIWDATKGMSGRKDVATSKVNKLLEIKVKEYLDAAEKASLGFWKDREKEFKDKLVSIIFESPCLSDEQRKIMENKIMQLNGIPSYHVSVSIQKSDITAGIWFWKHLKPDNAKHTFVESYKSEISKVNVELTAQSVRSFSDLQNKVDRDFKTMVTEHNPQLCYLREQFDKCYKSITMLNIQKEDIYRNKDNVDNLLVFRRLEKNNNEVKQNV